MPLSALRTLGRSGLPVSPLALGTMTFGNRGWGSPDDVSRHLFDWYIDQGGNFIDTADVYAGGRSEELLGHFIQERKLRDSVVVATKYSFAGGNGRKNLHRALEGSLRRLGTDYIDLLWVHVWDSVTPAEELLQSLGALVVSGKIRYFGLSDVPAWYATRLATLAGAHNAPGPIALQLAYSLVAREIEQEHVPAAQALGLGITPWSPLGAGFLSGKYTRGAEDGKAAPGGSGGRLSTDNQPFRMFSERNWAILDALREVSQELGRPPAEVALSWAAAQPGISSLILGASTLEQLTANVAALNLTLSPAHLERLDQASAPREQQGFYQLFSEPVRRSIFKGQLIEPWQGR